MTLNKEINQKGFHCAHLNCHSIYNKIEVISNLLTDSGSNLHVLGISETWLNELIPDNFVHLEGYDLVILDRGWLHPQTNNIKKGGGVCLYLRDSLQWNIEKYEFLNISNNYLEIQWIEIENKHCRNFIIANVYRPPDGNVKEFIDHLEASLNLLDLTKNDIFIMGDFHLDYFDNKIHGVKELKITLQQFGFAQHIKDPTRYCVNKNSCLDLICSNSDNVSNAKVCNVNISDHELVIITRKHVKIKDKRTSFIGRSYKNYDKDWFTNQLQNIDWNQYDNVNDPTLLWENLLNQVKTIIDQRCPLKRFRIRVTNEPWITNAIIEQIKDKDRALRRAKRTDDPDDWTRARRLRNDCLQKVRNSKSAFIQNELNAHFDEPKKFWDTISTVLPANSKGNSTIKLKDLSNNQCIDENATAEFINDFFSNIGVNLASKLTTPWSYKGDEYNHLMDDIQPT